jgi:hypothetical protein
MLTDTELLKQDENVNFLKQETLEILKVLSANRKNVKNKD